MKEADAQAACAVEADEVVEEVAVLVLERR